MRLILKVATDRVQEQSLSVYLQSLNLRSLLSEKGCVILYGRLCRRLPRIRSGMRFCENEHFDWLNSLTNRTDVANAAL